MRACVYVCVCLSGRESECVCVNVLCVWLQIEVNNFCELLARNAQSQFILLLIILERKIFSIGKKKLRRKFEKKNELGTYF